MKKVICGLMTIALLFSIFAVSGIAHGDFSSTEYFTIADAQGRYEQKVWEDGAGQGWSWDTATKTLTLNGITNGSFGSYNIKESSGPITIVLADGTENQFTGSLFLNGCDYILKGNGTLVIEPATGALYDDNGEYLTDAEGHSIYGDIPNLMSWNTKITMESGKIIGKMRGVHLQGKLILNGGTLELGCGIFGGIQSNTYKAIVNGGELIVSFTDCKNLDKYTQASSAAEMYRQDPELEMHCGLQDSPAVDQNGKALQWKTTDERLMLCNEDGSPATYAVISASDCYTTTGEKAHNWAVESVETAMEKGIVPDEGVYGFVEADLTENITRSEFAALVVELYETISGQALEAGRHPFEDVIYMNQDYVISKAYAAGLINGVSETSFAPEALLTREQASTILYRVYEKLGKGGEASASLFADDDQISDWAKKPVYFMADKGILQGMGENAFAPKLNTQKQQAIVIALRMYEDLK